VEDSREHDREPSGSIKCWEVLEWMQLLQKGSAPQVSEGGWRLKYEHTALGYFVHAMNVVSCVSYKSGKFRRA
jgi:hypothetical protein